MVPQWGRAVARLIRSQVPSLSTRAASASHLCRQVALRVSTFRVPDSAGHERSAS